MGLVKSIIEFVMDILEIVTFVASIFIVIYLFIVQPNQVKGGSMENTFYSSEYIFTSKITYKFRPIHRGDVIVFKSPRNQDIEYIKRVIGLPGDTVRVSNGFVFVNGIQLDEPYTTAQTNIFEGGFLKADQLITIAPEQLFVMGDNRPRSSDSRDFGPVPINSIIGQVFYRYFPLNRAGFIPNPYSKAVGLTWLRYLQPVRA
jgi:signal peptidase I